MTENRPTTKIMQPEWLNELLRLVDKASAAILSVYEQRENLSVDLKGDNSPVTQADIAAHRVLLDGLQRLTPSIPVLSEESEAIAFDTRKAWGSYWLVDPLDGTKEFIDGNGEFTVNVALIENHSPVFGVVMAPVSGDCYWGGSQYGSFKRSQGKEAEISVRSVPSDQKLTVISSRRHSDINTQVLLDTLAASFSPVDSYLAGSSLKFCVMAEGKADLYPRLAPTCEWDTAAAQAVLEGAGGYVVDLDFQPLAYNHKASLLNPFFYAIADSHYPWKKLLTPIADSR